MPLSHSTGMLVQPEVRLSWMPAGSEEGLCQSLHSEQETPAAKRPPPLGQWTCFPWCRQCDSDISVPEQRTPLMTTSSALVSPGQYQVSCGKPREGALSTFQHDRHRLIFHNSATRGRIALRLNCKSSTWRNQLVHVYRVCHITI